MGYCTSNIVYDSVRERVDRFFQDVDSKYGENYLWMKTFFDELEKKNRYYKKKWDEKMDRGK
jgi:hypothetical protein